MYSSAQAITHRNDQKWLCHIGRPKKRDFLWDQSAELTNWGTDPPKYAYIVASHLQRGSAIRWREDIEMDVAKISGGASNLAGYTKTHQDFVHRALTCSNLFIAITMLNMYLSS